MSVTGTKPVSVSVWNSDRNGSETVEGSKLWQLMHTRGA